jgi:hypothetical protein
MAADNAAPHGAVNTSSPGGLTAHVVLRQVREDRNGPETPEEPRKKEEKDIL